MTDWDHLWSVCVAVGVKPQDFWDMTLAEINACARAFSMQADRAQELQAWLIASVANIAGAKPKVTVDSLMPRRKKQNARDAETLLDRIAETQEIEENRFDVVDDKSKIAAFRERMRKAKEGKQ